MEPTELSTILKPCFTQKPEKSVEGKPYSRNTVKANSFRAGQNFFLVPFKESRFPLSGISSIQARKRSSGSMTERFCATGKLKTTTSRLKYFISSERAAEKSVHLQALQILHILFFTDVNPETKTHFFLVKFLNSSSEYMDQTRQVFEFLIQGALRESISHDSLSNLVQSQ